MTARLVPPIDALAAAIDRLRSVLAERPCAGDVRLEIAADEVARAIVHARRHLRGLEQTGRALLATTALLVAASPKDSLQIEESAQRAARPTETSGRKGS